MDNSFLEIMKALLSIVVALLCLILSKFRMQENRRFAIKYKDDTIMLRLRLLLTWTLKGLSVVILVGLSTNKLNVFCALYILTPILISLNLISYDSEWLKGFYIFIKGFYYMGATIISTIQYSFKGQEFGELVLGFSLSLAIFESITALSEGYKKMSNAQKIE